jgi:hypothetical protein
VLIHAEAGGYARYLNGKPYRPSAVSEKGLLLAPDPGSWQRLESALFSD